MAESKIKILIVEDEPETLNTLKVYMKRNGFDPVFQPDPAKARKLFESANATDFKYPLVILDKNLAPPPNHGPDPDVFATDEEIEIEGRELALLLRDKLPTLPIVLLSKCLNREDRGLFRGDPHTLVADKGSLLIEFFLQQLHDLLEGKNPRGIASE